MRHLFRPSLVAVVLFAGLAQVARSQSRPHPSPQAVEQAVRSFMQTVAHDVTHDGPWFELQPAWSESVHVGVTQLTVRYFPFLTSVRNWDGWLITSFFQSAPL